MAYIMVTAWDTGNCWELAGLYADYMDDTRDGDDSHLPSLVRLGASGFVFLGLEL